jgi:hypothetical protein
MTPLALVAYGTAAVVGIQLIGSGFSRLSHLSVRRDVRFAPVHHHSVPQAAASALVVLTAGLFLFLQGVAVALWTFA